MKVETTLQGTLHDLSAEAVWALSETARLFQCARRSAFQMLAEGQAREEIEVVLRERFKLDARFARDAILEAQAVHKAMREVLPRYLADVEAKIGKTKRRLERYQNGQRKPKHQPVEEAIAYLQGRLDKLQRKAERWRAHVQAKTTPPVIFGSASAFHARRRGKLSRVQWQALRRRQFWSRGEKGKGGNPHVQIVAQDEQFTIRLATLPQQNGRLCYITASLWLDQGQRVLLTQGLQDAYSVRVLKEGDQWRVHITVREQVPGAYLPQAPEGCLDGGLDCNTDRISAAVISPQGNLLAHRTFWLRALPDMRSSQATWHLSQALDAAIGFFQEHQVRCVVVEALSFAQNHDTHRRFNRATTRFRSTMVKLAARKALRCRMSVVEVNPAFSSVIGKHKYASAYGLSVHEAAALVIARRGQKREETLPRRSVGQFHTLRAALWAAAKDDPDPAQRRRYGQWASQLANWKVLHPWSLWSIWEGAYHLIQ